MREINILARGNEDGLFEIESILKMFDCHEFEKTETSIEDICILPVEEASEMINLLEDVLIEYLAIEVF